MKGFDDMSFLSIEIPQKAEANTRLNHPFSFDAISTSVILSPGYSLDFLNNSHISEKQDATARQHSTESAVTTCPKFKCTLWRNNTSALTHPVE